jgi:Ca-activated chloride channel family protein
MSFATPLALLALLLLPLGAAAYVWRSRRPRRDAIRFSAAPTLAALAAGEPQWRRHVPAVLLAVAVAALAMALAKPERTVAVADREASVMLVIDTSGSMAAQDVEPSRLEAVRTAANEFLDRVPKDLRVGVMSFAQTPLATTQPSTNRGDARDLLDGLYANGGTGTGDALQGALQVLRPRGESDRDKPAAIVLLSDGKKTSGRSPIGPAEQAKRLGVPVYTVALGTPEGTVPGNGVPFPVPPDPDTMRRVAALSGGRFYRVEDGARLSEIYQRLGGQIGSHDEQREISVAFAAAGLVALLAALALSVRRAPALP